MKPSKITRVLAGCAFLHGIFLGCSGTDIDTIRPPVPTGACAFLPGYLPLQVIDLPRCKIIAFDVYLTSKYQNDEIHPKSKSVTVELCSAKGDTVISSEFEVTSPIDGWVTITLPKGGCGVQKGRYILRLIEGGDYTPAFWWCFAPDYYHAGYHHQEGKDYKGVDMLFRVRYSTSSKHEIIETVGAP